LSRSHDGDLVHVVLGEPQVVIGAIGDVERPSEAKGCVQSVVYLDPA